MYELFNLLIWFNLNPLYSVQADYTDVGLHKDYILLHSDL